MSTAIVKNSKTKDLLVCRTCLATERRLYNIYEQNLLEAYQQLIGNQVSPNDRLPQHVCVYCAALLLKFNTFRRNSRLAQEILKETNHIQTTLTNKYHVSLTKSATKIVDVTQNYFVELNPDNNEQDFDYTESDNSKMFTDIIKNETPLTEDIKRSKISQHFKGFETKKNNSKSKNDCSNSSQNISLTNSNVKKKGKYFETDENMRDFENDYNVEVIVLSSDQQMEDVLSRKLSSNYLQSPYKCELCYKGVMDEDSLNKHVLYQHDPSRGPIVCQYCSFRYKDRRGLNQHLKRHRLKFACRQCPHVCRTTFNAKEHYKVHTGLTHRCRHCGRSYEKLSSHLTHLRTQHPSHFIWCDICGEAFIGQFGLNAHKKRAHRHLSLPYRCVSCSASFVSETALGLHSSFEHCSTVNCVHCGDSFERDMCLRDHLLEKHRVYKVYKCEKCNKTFSRQSLHSAHYRRTHVDGRPKGQVSRPWVCEVCGKTLPNKSVLLYHQRNHTGERPYQCSLCSKSFTMRKLLQSHLRVHSTDRPYTCKVCPKAFKGLSALRAHEHIHSGGDKKISTNRKT